MAKAKDENPDLILLDIIMSNKDGYTFVKNLKGDQALYNTPIIVLTAKEHMKDIFEMEGIREYILKTEMSEKLLDAIKKYL